MGLSFLHTSSVLTIVGTTYQDDPKFPIKDHHHHQHQNSFQIEANDNNYPWINSRCIFSFLLIPMNYVPVITLPLYSIISTVHYHTQNTECKDEILELIELYVPTLLTDILCRLDTGGNVNYILCKVSAGNPVCQTVEVGRQKVNSIKIETKVSFINAMNT